MTAAPPLHGARARSLALLLGSAVVLVALNLRGPLAALPAVAPEVRADLAVSTGAIGLLGTVPVLCFGLSAPLAAWVIARTGLHGSVLVTLAGVAAGTALRSAGDYGVALAGTVVLGLAITVGNIALPVVAADDFPAAVGLVTAMYTAALNLGGALTTAVTPLLAREVGWRWSLAAWAVLAVVAAALWLVAARQRRAGAGSAAPAGAGRPAAAGASAVWRRPGTWGLAAAFAGQAFAYYGATAWLPTLLLEERGMDLGRAGASASLFQLTAVAGAFCVPLLLRTTGRPRLVLWLVCAAWACLPVGLLLAPEAWWLWCALAGAAQGGGFTVVFVAVADRSGDPASARRLSATVQGAGYAVAALGPVLVGAAHDASGGWDWPLVVIGAAVALMLVAGSAVLPARRGR